MRSRLPRWLIGLALLLVFAEHVAAQDHSEELFPYEYQWSISGSDQHPYDNVGAPFTGERQVYLWLECMYRDGVTFARMDLTGTLEVVAFEGVNGIVNTGTLPALELTAPGCIADWQFLAGVLTVRDTEGTGGTLCFSGMNFTRDCSLVNPRDHAHGYAGYATTGSPCRLGDCAVDYALPESWSRTKARYRDD